MSIPRPTKWMISIPVALMALGAAACGDDDEASNGEDEVAAYCEFSASLDELDGLPSDEQFEELRDLAPAAISDAVSTAVDELIENGEAAFEDEANEEFFSALDEIEAYEEENCGREDADEADADDAETDDAETDDTTVDDDAETDDTTADDSDDAATDDTTEDTTAETDTSAEG